MSDPKNNLKASEPHEALDRGQVVRVVKRSGNYTIISNIPLEDERLSFRATGLIAYLLSKPDDWVIRLGQLVGAKAEGREAIRTGLRELEEAGYYQKVRRRDGRGRFFWVNLVFETPKLQAEHSPAELEALLQSIAPGSQPAHDLETLAATVQTQCQTAEPHYSPNSPDSISGAWTEREIIHRRETSAWLAVDGKPGPGFQTVVKTDSNTGGPRTDSKRADDDDEVFALENQRQRKKPQPEPGPAIPARIALETELMGIGISGEALDELTGLYLFLSPQRVSSEWHACKQRGTGTGALINNLRQIGHAQRRKNIAAASAWYHKLANQDKQWLFDRIWEIVRASGDEELIGRLQANDRETWGVLLVVQHREACASGHKFCNQTQGAPAQRRSA